jgi:hypothetical protein
MEKYRTYLKTDKSTQLILCGLITDGSESEVMIGGSYLVDEIHDNIDYEDKLTVKYMLSDKPIDPLTIEEDFLSAFYGDVELDNDWMCGSEWTGVYGKEDLLTVDGHDIINELYRNRGSYCYIKIEKINE